MSLIPTVSGVWPEPSDTDIILRPTIRVEFEGDGLVDPRSWTSGTFALFGPGDHAIPTGPGTILNSGLLTDPYALLDGPIVRDEVDGTYLVHTSGFDQTSGIVVDGNLGVSGNITYGLFTPDKPLQPNTIYTAVIVGDDALDWMTTDKSLPGVTSWTSEAAFAISGSQTTSGTMTLTESYSRTLQTSIYESTSGYNDTYRLEVLIGSTIGEPQFVATKLSDASAVVGDGPGPHQLFSEGLYFQPSGTFSAGEIFLLDVYVPRPLVNTYTWSFDTGELNLTTPPTTPVAPSVIIDETAAGGLTVSTSSADNELRLIATDPPHLDYDVAGDIPYILLKFNKVLLSGVSPPGTDSVQVISSPLLDLPGTVGSGIHRFPVASMEVSGQYLKVHL